jgi:hypothetical protein
LQRNNSEYAMIRLIALYFYYRDLQEERAQAVAAPAPAKAAAPVQPANEVYARHWATELAA